MADHVAASAPHGTAIGKALVTQTIVTRPMRMPRNLMLAMAISTILYVTIVMHVPVVLLATAGHDDALFVAHGLSIFTGHWLGPFNQMTLCKGPGYPLFLAFNAILGLPITLTQALLYSGACAVMGLTIFRLGGGITTTLLAFLSMQWHPAIFPYHIVRDDLSPPQVLLILACVCQFAFLPLRLRSRLAWGAAGGFVLAWFWMTREDGIWLLPGLLVLMILQAARVWRSARGLLHMAAGLGAFLTVNFLTLGIVASINLAVYGTFVITDFKAAPFAKTLNILETVRVGEPVPYVPVPKKVRDSLDKVSPAFASLEPFLNGVGQIWTRAGCAIYASTCHDFAGGWFMWALRDAVAATGHYSSPQAAAAFYRQLYGEVHLACRQGKLECRNTLLPFMPAMRPDQWQALPGAMAAMYALATEQENGLVWSTGQRLSTWSTGSRDQLHIMEDFLRYPRRTLARSDRYGIAVSGWFHDHGDGWLDLRCRTTDGTVVQPVQRQSSPDLATYFHSETANHQRFIFAVPSTADCALETTGSTAPATQLQLSEATLGQTAFGDGRLNFDRITYSSYLLHGGLATKFLVGITILYGWVLSVLTIPAVLLYLGLAIWTLLRDKRQFGADYIIIATLGALLLVRATILVLVQISSFPGIIPLYWGAGYPLLCLAIVMSLSLPFRSHRSKAGQVGELSSETASCDAL